MPRSILAVLAFAFFAVTASPAAFAGSGQSHGPDGVVMKRSAHSVEETLDRLEALLDERGVKVFTRIDHAAGAESIGESLRPSQVLIFGHPRMGTPLMQANPIVAINLPQRVLAFEDAEGLVWLVHNIPSHTADQFDIENRDEVIEQTAKALNTLTSAAVSAE